MGNTEVIYAAKYYEVIPYDNCMGEDNKLGHAGYAVRNKERGTIEHTSIMLPSALYQCDHFDGAVKAFFEENVEDVMGEVTEDITVLN